MSTALYSEAWQILSEAEDIILDHVGDDVKGARRLLDRMMWERVQLDMLLGEDYGEDDIAEYRRAAG